MYFDNAAPPDGFKAYAMASPVAYLANAIATSLFLFFCCDDGPWMLGKIMKYKPKANKFNFDVQWQSNTTQQHGTELAKYYHDGDAAVAGSWRYLEKIPRTRVRARSDSGEDDDEGNGGGDGDAQGRRRIEAECDAEQMQA